jgi:hypothetical protein
MSTSGAAGPRLPVVFREGNWDSDLRRIGDRGQELARGVRARLERDGIALAELRRCEAEGPDGTRLQGCVKLYLDRCGASSSRATCQRRESHDFSAWR